MTSDERNREKVQAFHGGKSGRNLETYLKENAWDEDQQGITKVYLVKDIETEEIVFFFALSAGQEYSFGETLTFPLGFYVFWEIVVKEVLHIASLLGCQYLYLFAADNTEQSLSRVTVLIKALL